MKALAVLQQWFAQHARSAVTSLGQLGRRPTASLMTTAVIGIALALPAGFLLIMDNLEAATAGWDGNPRASIFLADGLPDNNQRELIARIQNFNEVTATQLITPEAALAEFEQHAGMEETLALLDENPFPAVIVAELDTGLGTLAADQLIARAEGLAGVDQVRVDRVWLQRLTAILQLANRGTLLIGLLLGLTVVLVVGNTIRLDIENRRAEIEITKLIGGTDAFVRRPFLYTGLWYGISGGLLAAIILAIAMGLLAGPAKALTSLYGAGFRVLGLGVGGTLTLLLGGILLGLIGAWVAVGRHLAAIEPQ